MATIRDISEKAGVAKSTVSRYLNDGYVSEATRKKIEQTIKDSSSRLLNNFNLV
ncbi:hypothetical protein J18TS1_10460 [Oceanobacillus oncorhynchi subsp. incaldanensis]|uniref:HTH-type transcriptional repressor PurR n=1 Tax=Oceanobacillus oncorhynchi TaxID=545501 RepID=A0A0A1MMW0_9BACI|nr:hypothetical protein J18TS1_10460 [Oceanobacillus oncorhynchi subsp. incaldanensis]CEI81149.1 HTH-type transcriptional repressor PurR [Oceanobacillus oncorhynchi]